MWTNFFSWCLSFGAIDIFKSVLPSMYMANSLCQLFLLNTNTVIMGLFIDFQLLSSTPTSVPLLLSKLHINTFPGFLSCFPNPAYLCSRLTCYRIPFDQSDLPVMFLSLKSYRISCIINTKKYYNTALLFVNFNSVGYKLINIRIT